MADIQRDLNRRLAFVSGAFALGFLRTPRSCPRCRTDLAAALEALRSDGL